MRARDVVCIIVLFLMLGCFADPKCRQFGALEVYSAADTVDKTAVMKGTTHMIGQTISVFTYLHNSDPACAQSHASLHCLAKFCAE